MTVSFGSPLRYCGDCFQFDVVICDNIGVCVEIRSDHNRHVLDASHSGCAFWKKRP